MRRFLDGLYTAAAWLAAVCMLGVLGMVLTSIVTRQIGVHVPGTDAYAGYLMAASGFLAMAHTLKHNEHIRVTLLVHALRGGARRAIELWSLAVAVFLSGALAWYAVRLVAQSREFNDISTGNDATPLWLPQLSFAIGALVLLIAFVDELVLELRGRSHEVAATVDGEPLRNE